MEPFQCFFFVFLHLERLQVVSVVATQPGCLHSSLADGGLGWGGGSDNDKSEQTKGGSQEEIACLPEMCDSCCWKRGRKLENETIQEALRNRWIGTLAPPPDFPVESLPLSPPDLSF